MKKYPVEQWHEKAMNGSNMILINHFLSPEFFEGWLFSHQLSETPFAHARNTVYFFKRDGNDNNEAIRVDVTEADSIKGAEQLLLDMLTNVMAPMEFPEANTAGLGIVCYKGFSDINSLLMFLRANLVIRVRSIGQKEIHVLDEAKKIDTDIVSEPEENGTRAASKLNIDFSAPAYEVIRQLGLKDKDAEGKKLYYKITAPDHKTELTRNGLVAHDIAIPSRVTLHIIREDGAVTKVQLK